MNNKKEKTTTTTLFVVVVGPICKIRVHYWSVNDEVVRSTIVKLLK